MQDVLDTAAVLVGGGDDSRALRGELGVEMGVVEGDGELAGDEGDRVDPVRCERTADQTISNSRTARIVPRLRIGTASSEQQARLAPQQADRSGHHHGARRGEVRQADRRLPRRLERV